MKIIQKKCLEFIDFGIYPGYCMFSNGYTYDDLIEELSGYKGQHDQWALALEDDRKLIENGNYLALHREVYKGTDKPVHYFYIITKDPFKFTDYEMTKLAHECLHICQFFLPDLLDRNREYESEAYFHTHIMSQCLKILRKNKVKNEESH